MFGNKALKKENETLKSELMLTRKAADIYKYDQQESWNIKIKESINEPIKILSVKYNDYDNERER